MNPAKQQLHIHAQIEASYTHLNINSEGKMIRIHRKYHNLTTFLYNQLLNKSVASTIKSRENILSLFSFKQLSGH